MCTCTRSEYLTKYVNWEQLFFTLKVSPHNLFSHFDGRWCLRSLSLSLLRPTDLLTLNLSCVLFCRSVCQAEYLLGIVQYAPRAHILRFIIFFMKKFILKKFLWKKLCEPTCSCSDLFPLCWWMKKLWSINWELHPPTPQHSSTPQKALIGWCFGASEP
jgi:hypothetical protein